MSSYSTTICLRVSDANFKGKNVDADTDANVVIHNIHICIMQLSLLGIRIRIMRLLSTRLLQLLNAVILRYPRMRSFAFWTLK
jgi:hypothetical protein